jgi:hypothetical protein
MQLVKDCGQEGEIYRVSSSYWAVFNRLNLLLFKFGIEWRYKEHGKLHRSHIQIGNSDINLMGHL